LIPLFKNSKHQYNEKYEWLILDTHDVGSTKNITKIFNVNIECIDFFGTSGNIFYALESGDIRKIDFEEK
jgi:hypothetical protein